MKKPKDMSDKLDCYYGELKEGHPFDYRNKLPIAFIEVLTACKPYSFVAPQYDDKLATETHFVWKRCGLEKEFFSLGRPMDNRKGTQVGYTCYIHVSDECPVEIATEMLRQWMTLNAGYKGGYMAGSGRSKHRFASDYVGMVAVALGFRLRAPYGDSIYQKQEIKEQNDVRAYPRDIFGNVTQA